GASLFLTGVAASTVHVSLDVKAGSLQWMFITATLDALTLEGGSFGGSGNLTVGNFNWNGGQLGGGGGTLSSGNGGIGTAAEKQLQAPYTWNSTGFMSWYGGNLHGLVPGASGAKFIINNSGTFDIFNP